MDALFIVVAELLVIPLILWALIVLELTVGVVASIFAIFAGRRSLTTALMHSWRTVRRRLLWSLIFMTTGLLAADLVFFDPLVRLALDSADERDDLDLSFGLAEGSFILGRIELRQLTLAGERGGPEDPSARFAVSVDSLVIDIDTQRLLFADFAVEELSLDGVRGSLDRLQPSTDAGRRKPDAGAELREFSVERVHFGDVRLDLRDHTGEQLREFEAVIAELDVGPVASDSLVFDLLYRSRGRGSIAGHEFRLSSVTADGVPQTTLELPELPLDAIADPLERIAGVRAGGSASLTVVDRYREGPPEPHVEIAVALRLRELELEPGPEASAATRFALELAARKLAQLGDDFPLEFEISVLQSELAGIRSLAESGVLERVADAIAEALRAQLERREPTAP